MIVWCGRCDTVPIGLSPNGIDAVSWFGMTAERPWCWACCLVAMYQWPHIGVLVGTPVQRRRMRDTDTCPHGIQYGPRYCARCDRCLCDQCNPTHAVT